VSCKNGTATASVQIMLRALRAWARSALVCVTRPSFVTAWLLRLSTPFWIYAAFRKLKNYNKYIPKLKWKYHLIQQRTPCTANVKHEPTWGRTWDLGIEISKILDLSFLWR
jgi:hypothetical protein